MTFPKYSYLILLDLDKPYPNLLFELFTSSICFHALHQLSVFFCT